MGLLDDIRLQGATYRLTEEAIYAEVLREMEAGVRRDGLWAKALAESPASESQAKSRYIGLRAQALKDEIAVARAAMAKLVAAETAESKQTAIQNAENEARQAALQAQNQRTRETAAAEAEWNKRTSTEKKSSHRKRFWGWSVALVVFVLLMGVDNWDSHNQNDKLRALFIMPALGCFAMALLHLIESLKKNPRR